VNDRGRRYRAFCSFLKTGIPWEYLPQEMGCGAGMTCWRRLRDWQRAGVWDHLHRVLLETALRGADQLDWSRAAGGQCECAGGWGGEKTGPNPTRPPQERLEAPRPYGCAGRSARFSTDQREYERGHAVAAAGGRAPGRQRQTGRPAAPPGGPLRGPAYYSHLRRMLLLLAGHRAVPGQAAGTAREAGGEVSVGFVELR